MNGWYTKLVKQITLVAWFIGCFPFLLLQIKFLATCCFSERYWGIVQLDSKCSCVFYGSKLYETLVGRTFSPSNVLILCFRIKMARFCTFHVVVHSRKSLNSIRTISSLSFLSSFVAIGYNISLVVKVFAKILVAIWIRKLLLLLPCTYTAHCNLYSIFATSHLTTRYIWSPQHFETLSSCSGNFVASYDLVSSSSLFFMPSGCPLVAPLVPSVPSCPLFVVPTINTLRLQTSSRPRNPVLIFLLICPTCTAGLFCSTVSLVRILLFWFFVCLATADHFSTVKRKIFDVVKHAVVDVSMDSIVSVISDLFCLLFSGSSPKFIPTTGLLSVPTFMTETGFQIERAVFAIFIIRIQILSTIVDTTVRCRYRYLSIGKSIVWCSYRDNTLLQYQASYMLQPSLTKWTPVGLSSVGTRRSTYPRLL